MGKTVYTSWDTAPLTSTLWVKDNRHYGTAHLTVDMFTFVTDPNIIVDDDSVVVEWVDYFGELTSSRFYGLGGV